MGSMISRALTSARELGLAPVLNEFAVFRVFHGFGSATSVYDLADESMKTDQLMVLLYVGDYDPSGMHMSEVDLPERIERYGGIVNLERIALTEDDCGDDLPSFSVEEKRKDPRYDWFVRHYRNRCWEIDAMNPNALRDRVRKEIQRHIDMEVWDHCKRVEAAERESIKSYFDKWPK